MRFVVLCVCVYYYHVLYMYVFVVVLSSVLAAHLAAAAATAASPYASEPFLNNGLTVRSLRATTFRHLVIIRATIHTKTRSELPTTTATAATVNRDEGVSISTTAATAATVSCDDGVSISAPVVGAGGSCWELLEAVLPSVCSALDRFSDLFATKASKIHTQFCERVECEHAGWGSGVGEGWEVEREKAKASGSFARRMKGRNAQMK